MAGAGWKGPQVGLRTAARGGGGFLDLRSMVEALSRVVFFLLILLQGKRMKRLPPRGRKLQGMQYATATATVIECRGQ